jgi:hypothetical protein
MPYRIFEENLPLHVLSRSVEDRKIFKKEENCYRFIFQIYAANVGKPALNLQRRDVIKAAQAILNGEEPSSEFVIKEHLPLVYLFDFVLPVTHFHLYLLPKSKKSLSLFMKKLKGGFAKYFNLKNLRQGTLFAGPYKSIQIESQNQSDAVIRYITIINTLDVYQPGWREKGLKDWKGAYNFLVNFQFSSFPDRIGKRRAKILAPPEIYEKYSLRMGGEKEFKKFTENFFKEKFVYFDSLFLE